MLRTELSGYCDIARICHDFRSNESNVYPTRFRIVEHCRTMAQLWPNYGLPPGLPSESRYGSGEIVQGIISACDA